MSPVCALDSTVKSKYGKTGGAPAFRKREDESSDEAVACLLLTSPANASEVVMGGYVLLWHFTSI